MSSKFIVFILFPLVFATKADKTEKYYPCKTSKSVEHCFFEQTVFCISCSLQEIDCKRNKEGRSIPGLLTSVVPIPKGDKNEIFHLLHNGSDTSDCGGSVDSACATFLYVLTLYFSEPPEMGLEIRTDMSINIMNDVLVRLTLVCENKNQCTTKLVYCLTIVYFCFFTDEMQGI